MKKRKVAVALGLCLAVGLCGASLVACGDDTDDKPNDGGDLVISETEKSDYYLFGKSKSEIYTKAHGEWAVSPAKTAAEVPDSIAVWKTNKANTYAVKVDMYAGDEFAFLVVGQEYNGQLATAYVRPTLTKAEEVTDDDYLSDTEGGGAQGNIKVEKDGNYTFVINPDSTITWTYNGYAAALPTQYNYWVMGEYISGGEKLYNDLTAFKSTDNTNYTVTLNLKENEKISIIGAAKTDGTDKSKSAPIDHVTLKDNAAISAVAAAQDDEATTYQYQAGAAGSYTITIKETDEENPDHTVTTKREVDATKTDAVEYAFKAKSSTGGDTFLNKHEYDFQLNNETGKYELTFTATEKAAEAAQADEEPDYDDVKVGDTFAFYAVESGDSLIGDNKKEPLYTLGASFLASWGELTYGIDYQTNTVKYAGEYTVAIDPVTFEVTVTKEGDPDWAYGVYVHGSFGGASWADNSGENASAIAYTDNATVELTLELKAGDEFGIRTFYASDYGKTEQKNWASTTAENIIEGKLEANGNVGSNFIVKAAGTYKFTVTVNANGEITTVATELVAEAEAPAA